MDNPHVPLGPLGIWTFQLDLLPASRAQEQVAELEALGFGAVWIPEAVNRDAIAAAGLWLAGSSRIAVATGVASIWGRIPMTMNAAHRTLTEAYPGRFLLGLGVSHQVMVDGLQGQHYDRPLSTMRDYLEKMDAALYLAPQPAQPPQRVLAALGPKMLGLASTHAAGALSYFVPAEHTAVAREHLGPEPLLAVELAVVLETDPTKAREIARTHTEIYTPLPNYTNNARRFGFTDEDFVGAGSDRLVDAIVAWGDVDTIAAKVQAHRDAGADHVCLQVLAPGRMEVPRDLWRELAPALVEGAR